MEVEITIRVRAEIPDGTHLPALGVDRDLFIPLHYLTQIDPVPKMIDLMPRILTLQSDIRPTPPDWAERDLDASLPTRPTHPESR